MLQAHVEKHNVNKIIITINRIAISLNTPADPSKGESKTLNSNSMGQVMVGSNTTAHISTNPASSSTW